MSGCMETGWGWEVGDRGLKKYLRALLLQGVHRTSLQGIAWVLVRNAETQARPQRLLNPNLHFNKIPRCFMCTLQCGKHCCWVSHGLDIADYISVVPFGMFLYLPCFPYIGSWIYKFHLVWAWYCGVFLARLLHRWPCVCPSGGT